MKKQGRAGAAPFSSVCLVTSLVISGSVGIGGYFCVLVQKSIEGEKRLSSSIIQGLRGKLIRAADP